MAVAEAGVCDSTGSSLLCNTPRLETTKTTPGSNPKKISNKDLTLGQNGPIIEAKNSHVTDLIGRIPE